MMASSAWRRIVLLALFLAAPAAGQDEPALVPGQSVYVRDSAIAVEKLALAERMERLREWSKAADLYHEIVTRHTDRVVPSRHDAAGNALQFTSVALVVQERLARWPAEGLAAYRARFEPEARALLEQAGDDPNALQPLLTRYFATGAASEAARRLVDRSLQAGEFSAASRLARRMAGLDPTDAATRAAMLLRAGIAEHLSGRDAEAAEALDLLRRDHAETPARVAGADRPAAEALAAVLAMEASPSPAPSGAWRMPFGAPDRAAAPDLAPAQGARLFSIELPLPAIRGVAAAQAREILQMLQRDREGGAMTGVMPVVDRGELFFQDNARVYAVSVESGLPLPGWAATYEGRDAGRHVVRGAGTPRGVPHAVALTDDALLAFLGQPDATFDFVGGGSARAASHLACLDRASGAVRWIVRPGDLPGDPNPLQHLGFVGSPLPVGPNVYVLGRGGRGGQFEDAHLLCFDLATGALRWSTFIASATRLAAQWDVESPGNSGVTAAHLAVEGGRVFVNTNLGALACLDAHDGTILWLSLYPREAPQGQRLRPIRAFTVGAASRPWEANPVIAVGGRVFALPSDGTHLVVHDADSGEELRRVPRARFDEAGCLIGVRGPHVLLCSPRRVFAVDWASADEAAPEAAIAWATRFAKPGQPEDAIRGRPFLAADWMLVPTAWGLHRIDLATGLIDDVYPSAGTWADEEEPGNVLVAGDHLVIAGASRVNVYTDLDRAIARLAQRIEAAPQDPAPRLRLAEILLVAGRVDDAVKRLDDAIAVATPTGRPELFAATLTFARRLQEQPTPPAAALRGLYDRAAALASEASEQLAWRVARAEFVRADDPGEAIGLYQQILADATLRGTTSRDGSGAWIAERGIDALKRLAADGVGAYASIDRDASAAFESARAARDPARLIEVASTYPNSTSATPALLAAADAFESLGNPRSAAGVLRQLLSRSIEPQTRSRVLESLARAYLAMPGREEVATARLAQAARLTPDRPLDRALAAGDLAVPEGTALSEAAAALRRRSDAAATAQLPDVALPHVRGPQPAEPALAPPGERIDGIAAVVAPARPFTRHDRLVAWTNAGSLSIHAIASGKPLCASDALRSRPLGAAWIGGSLLAWSEGEVALIDPTTGQATWTLAMIDLPTGEPSLAAAAEPEGEEAEAPAEMVEGFDANNVEGGRVRVLQLNGQQIILRGNQRIAIRNGQVFMPAAPVGEPAPRFTNAAVLSDRVVLATGDGRLTALDLADGRVLWVTRVGDRVVERLAGSEDFVVCRTGDASSVHLVVLDASSGRVVSRRVFSLMDGEQAMPVNFALSPDGTLVYLLPDRICGKDLFEPGEQLTFDVPAGRVDGPSTFGGAAQEEHLRIVGDRILALSDGGSYVRVHALSDGRLLRQAGAEALLPTGATNSGWRVRLLVDGASAYLAGPASIAAHDLDRPENAWRGTLDADIAVVSVELTRRHLLVLTRAGLERRRAQGPEHLTLYAYSRARLDDGRESRILEHIIPLEGRPGVLSVTPVEGGLYVLTAAGELRFHGGSLER